MASVAKTIVCVFFGLMLLGLTIEHPWLLALAIPAAGVGAVVSGATGWPSESARRLSP